MIRKVFCTLMAFALMGMIVGCGNRTQPEASNSQEETSAQSELESTGLSPDTPLQEGEPEPEDDPEEEADDAEEIEEEARQTAATAEDSAQPVAEPEQNTDTATGGKTLVVYLSHTGSTATVADHIINAIDADVFVIIPVDAYPSDYNTHLDVAQQELSDDARPAIQGSVSNMADYDAILLGYPIWWGYAPRPVATFLESHDLSGKTIAPFCTSGSSGMGRSADEIAELAPDAEVASGLSITGSNTGNAANLVQEWLAGLGLL